MSFLEDIPVNLMQGVGEAITEKLGKIGVNTIGQLAQIPQVFINVRKVVV